MELDHIDVEIIKLLQKDGRIMYKDIAQQVGVSLPTVRVRINRLMNLGVIKKFTVIVNPDRILGRVRALFMLQVEPGHIDEVCQKLGSMDEVREVYIAAGSSNIVTKLEVKDVADLADLTSKRLPQVDGVLGISCLVITRTEKEEYGGAVEPNSIIQFKCSFCNAPIVGMPWIEYIDGGRYYFNAKECAEAYKQQLGPKRQAERDTRVVDAKAPEHQ